MEYDTLRSQIAKQFQKLGYKVSEEAQVILKNGRRCIVDLVATKKGETILIECGYTDPYRLEQLKKEYRVLHYPYLKTLLPELRFPVDPLEGRHYLKYKAV